MRFKLTVVLVLLNAALLAAIFHLEWSAASRERFNLNQRLVFSPALIDGAEWLRLESPLLEQPWELRRSSEGEWQLIEPIQWPANPFAINVVLRSLRQLEWETRFSRESLGRAGQDLGSYGLASPRASLTIGRGSAQEVIQIGQATEVGNRLYILSTDGEEIYVVDRDLLVSLSMNLEELRSEGVLSIPAFEARGLQIQTGGAAGPKVRLRRSNGGRWVLEAPLEAAADHDRVEAALTQLQSLNVADFPLVGPEIHGLNEPSLRLTVEGNNRRQTLLIGRADPEGAMVYARIEDNPTVFTVPATAFDVFREAQVTLRDRQLMRFDPSSLTAVDISGQNLAVTLQVLETGAWQVMRRADGDRLQSWDAEKGIVQNTLQEINDVMAQRFGTDAPSASVLEARGLLEPQRRVTVRHADGEQTLLIGDLDPDSNLLWARRANAPSIYQIRPDILHAIPLNPLHYRSRTLDSLARAARIHSIDLIDLTDGTPIISDSIDPERTTWALHWAQKPEAERDALTALLDNLRRFRVDRYLRESFDDSLRLDAETMYPWRYQLRARIVLPGGDSTQNRELEYFFTERIGGTTQFGGSEAHGIIFTLPSQLIDALHTLTFQDPDPQLPTDLTPEPSSDLDSGEEPKIDADDGAPSTPSTEEAAVDQPEPQEPRALESATEDDQNDQ